MAALTITSGTLDHGTAGRWKEKTFDLPAVSDGDTVDVPGLGKVKTASVEHIGGDAVAADSITVASISGNTITFQVAGTARTARVWARGY